METRMNKYYNRRKFMRYIGRTYKNKLAALALFATGALAVHMLNDGTFLLFALIIGIPMFLTTRDCFYHGD